MRVATPADSYDGILDAVARLVARVEDETGMRGTVGVGHPGVISPATGLIKGANSTVLIGKALGVDLEARLQRAVRLANDANCFALSEASDGAARGAAVVFGVIAGTGIGGGIVAGGELLTGVNAIAGEWGHNPLPWPDADELPGPACYCGKRGCIETWLSGTGLAADYARLSGRRLAAIELPAASAAGDDVATRALERHALRFAKSLAIVVNVLDPEVVVLGGGVSNLPHLRDDVERHWSEFIFSDTVATRLERAAHGDSSGVRGAAWLWPETQS